MGMNNLNLGVALYEEVWGYVWGIGGAGGVLLFDAE